MICVYAQILHCNEIEASDIQDMAQVLQQMYTITIGSDIPLEVTVLSFKNLLMSLKKSH